MRLQRDGVEQGRILVGLNGARSSQSCDVQGSCLLRCIMRVSWKRDQKLQLKARPKSNPMTFFGDFIVAGCLPHLKAYRRAKGIVQLAVEVQVVKFCGRGRVVIS